MLIRESELILTKFWMQILSTCFFLDLCHRSDFFRWNRLTVRKGNPPKTTERTIFSPPQIIELYPFDFSAWILPLHFLPVVSKALETPSHRRGWDGSVQTGPLIMARCRNADACLLGKLTWGIFSSGITPTKPWRARNRKGKSFTLLPKKKHEFPLTNMFFFSIGTNMVFSSL